MSVGDDCRIHPHSLRENSLVIMPGKGKSPVNTALITDFLPEGGGIPLEASLDTLASVDEANCTAIYVWLFAPFASSSVSSLRELVQERSDALGPAGCPGPHEEVRDVNLPLPEAVYVCDSSGSDADRVRSSSSAHL